MATSKKQYVLLEIKVLFVSISARFNFFGVRKCLDLRLVFISDGVVIGVVRDLYNLVKIENRSRKRSHKLDGIRVGKIRTFPFLPISFATSSLMIP